MMKYLILLIPVLMYADNLRSLLDYTNNNNDLIISKTLTQKSKSTKITARENAYYPTIDTGAFYKTLNEKSPFQAGDVYSGYAKVSFDIYDGGKKSSLLNQSKNEYKASSFDTKSTKKGISLQITQDFFNIKSLKATLFAKNEAKKSLREQLTRIQRFYLAKLATKDDVDRLQAAYDTNMYEMQSIKFNILSLKKSLELMVGKTITDFDNSKFKKPQEHKIELIDSVKSLMSKKNALIDLANSIDSIYNPHIRIEDTYNIYGYDRSDLLHREGPNKQNKLLISMNLRVFDKETALKNKQSLIIESQALNSKITYDKKQQQMQFHLALSRINTSKIKIKSAKSALISASSAFETISKKYDAGIVDNVTFLDALSSKTSAIALYETSLNDLEIAYASYYFYAGKNIEEFLQ